MEPHIIVNGVELSESEAMTLRCALEHFKSFLMEDKHALGDDEHGLVMRQKYLNCAGDISRMILRGL